MVKDPPLTAWDKHISASLLLPDQESARDCNTFVWILLKQHKVNLQSQLSHEGTLNTSAQFTRSKVSCLAVLMETQSR